MIINYSVLRTHDSEHRLLTYVLFNQDILINTGNFNLAKIEEFNTLKELNNYLKIRACKFIKNSVVEVKK